jgi:putative phosphoesterase
MTEKEGAVREGKTLSVGSNHMSCVELQSPDCMSETHITRIGIIADTHGLLRPEALEALRGCDRIIHAGDIGKPEILDGLRALAPVTAIRGNVDRGAWANQFPVTETLLIHGVVVHVLHDGAEFNETPASDTPWVVISGHSHKPSINKKPGVLWINPGSAGPRRFKLPISIALLEIDQTGNVQARLIELDVTAPSQPIS